MSNSAGPRLILGCPLWAEPAWQGALYSSAADADQRLYEYSRVFSAVEGNTTFYALPKAATVSRWAEVLPADFKFCAKLPRDVSHAEQLDGDHPALRTFFERMAPLEQRLGPIWLQLPPRFHPQQLPQLISFLNALPDDYQYAVEVRHLDFFRKDEHERRLNRLLHDQGMERIIFDSRSLFASTADDPATAEAQARKPRLPVHALALTKQPTVRFIGGMDNQHSLVLLEPWLHKCQQWLEQGKNPMVFMHTPDNRLAPELARLFEQAVRELYPQLPPMQPWPGEQELWSAPQQKGLF